MKNLDSFSKRFLAISMGVSVVLLFASLFVFSINRVNAKPEYPTIANSTQVTGAGKYMMSYQAFVYNDGKTGYNVLVWDTETGKSKIYYYKFSSGTMEYWAGGNLPANPLN